MDEILSSTVTVVVVDGHNRSIDGELFEVGTAMTVQLSIEVGEDPTLQQGVLGEVDTTHDMAGLELLQLTRAAGRRGAYLP